MCKTGHPNPVDDPLALALIEQSRPICRKRTLFEVVPFYRSQDGRQAWILARLSSCDGDRWRQWPQCVERLAQAAEVSFVVGLHCFLHCQCDTARCWTQLLYAKRAGGIATLCAVD